MSNRWRGARDLVFESVELISRLVEKTQREESERWTERVARLEPVAPGARGVNALHLTGAALTHTSIRMIARAVGVVARGATNPFLDDAEQEEATPMRQDAMGTRSWWIDHVEAALNGLYGDFLASRDNALDLGMTLRDQGRVVAPGALATTLASPTSRVCLFVHGLTATEWSWVVEADRFWGDPEGCFGLELADAGITPLYVRYNTGRHISDSGAALDELLEAIVEAYPIPIDELTLIGHSMGGLVARSAAHRGAQRRTRWAEANRHVFCIGSPHLGAPLEKGVNLATAILRRIPAAGASVPADLLDARSAGIKDLRYGYTLAEEWQHGDPEATLHDNRHDVPLAEGVSYYAIAATITEDAAHPAGQLFGDLLVRPGSASGLADEPERHIPFHSREVIEGMNHLHLANHPAVYAILKRHLLGA